MRPCRVGYKVGPVDTYHRSYDKPTCETYCTHSIGRVGSMTGTTASVVAYTQSYALAVRFGASTYCNQSGLGRHSTATRTLPATILRARDRPREQTGRHLTGGGLSALMLPDWGTFKWRDGLARNLKPKCQSVNMMQQLRETEHACLTLQ